MSLGCGVTVAPSTAGTDVCSCLKAACNPGLLMFRHTLLINSMNLLMVCLYLFVLLSALSLWFNSSFSSLLLCPNLLTRNNYLLFFSLQFCLAKKKLSSLVVSCKKGSSFPDHNLVFSCLKNACQKFIISFSFFLGKTSAFWAKTDIVLFLSTATTSSTKTDSSYYKEPHRQTVQVIQSSGEINSTNPPETFLICFSNTFLRSKSCLCQKYTGIICKK